MIGQLYIPKTVVAYDPRLQGRLTLPPPEIVSSTEYKEYVARVQGKYADKPEISPLTPAGILPTDFLSQISQPFDIQSLRPYLPYILIGFGILIVMTILKKPK